MYNDMFHPLFDAHLFAALALYCLSAFLPYNTTSILSDNAKKGKQQLCIAPLRLPPYSHFHAGQFHIRIANNIIFSVPALYPATSPYPGTFPFIRIIVIDLTLCHFRLCSSALCPFHICRLCSCEVC